MRRQFSTIGLLILLSGTVHATDMDTPEAILLDQDRINSEQADRSIEAVQKQMDSLDQMGQSGEPDRYEAEDLDHAREMWDKQGLRK